MFTKRLLRFSIGAMLVLTAFVALLLNHEVRRAQAIETTVKKIQEWDGRFTLGPRERMPQSLASILPKTWAQEIDSIWVAIYSKQRPEVHFMFGTAHSAVIDDREFKELIKLGALDNLETIVLFGSAIKREDVSRLCKSPSMDACVIADTSLTENEIEVLAQLYPQQLRLSVLPIADDVP